MLKGVKDPKGKKAQQDPKGFRDLKDLKGLKAKQESPALRGEVCVKVVGQVSEIGGPTTFGVGLNGGLEPFRRSSGAIGAGAHEQCLSRTSGVPSGATEEVAPAREGEPESRRIVDVGGEDAGHCNVVDRPV